MNINTVNGNATLRLPEGYPSNSVVRSVSGKIVLDGVVHSGSGTTSYTGSSGELSGQFVDVRVNTVSGDLTVLRRPTEHTGSPATDGEMQS